MMKCTGKLLFFSIFIAACGTKMPPVKTVAPPRTFDIGTGEIVNSVGWSPDGKTIIAGGQNKIISLIDAETGKVAWQSPPQPDAVLAVAISPDGRYFAATCSDNTQQTAQVAVFSMQDKNEIWGKKNLTNDVQAIRFSSDGKTLLAANFFSIFVFEAATGKQLNFFSGHAADVVAPYGHVGAVTSMTFTKNPNRFVSVGWDRNVKVWDFAEGHEIKTYPESDPINACFLMDDDNRIVTAGSGAIHVWNRETNLPDTIVAYSGEIQSMVRVPGKQQFITGDDAGNLVVWDMTHFGRVNQVTKAHDRGVWSMDITSDGSTIVTSGGGGKVTIWSLEYLLAGPSAADSAAS
jgi:tricorn protease-like protein